MPASGTDDEASTAEAPDNPIAANTSNFAHPITWIDAAGDAVTVAENASALDYPYLDVAGGTVAEVIGREMGLDRGRAARIAVRAIEHMAGRSRSNDDS